MRRVCVDEQGSISGIYVVLLVALVLLLMVAMDREWVHYMYYTADETADFAAEAGAQFHEVFYNVSVLRQQYFKGPLPPECTLQPDLAVCKKGPPVLVRFDYRQPQLYQKTALANGGWRTVFGCSDGNFDPNWSCFTPVVVGPPVFTFSATTTEVATTAFHANWQDRLGATVHNVTATCDAGQGIVYVHVDLEIGSLFGLFPHHIESITRAAKVQDKALRFP